MRGAFLAACLTGAGLATGACTLAPPYRPPRVMPPATYGPTGAWQPATPGDELPRGAWWQRYADATLDDLEAELGRASPDLGAAAARYAEARALAVEASAGLFPFLGGGALATHDRQSDNRPLRSASQPAFYRDYLVGTGASYELDLWGRVRSQSTLGRATAQATAAELATARLSLEAELAGAYLTLRGLDAEIRLLADTVQAYGRALALAQSRHDGGIASGLDVARAQTQLDTASAQLTEASARRSLFEHAIARLVGMPAPDFHVPADPTLPPIPAIPLGLPSTLVERRPDVAAAERRTAAANASIGLARAAYFPRVTITASGGYESTGSQDWLTVPNRLWAIGPMAALTLLDGGARRAEVSRAESTLLEATERYRATVLTAFQEVADNLSLLELLQQEVVEEERAAAAARRALSLATNRYTEGAVNYLEVVVAQTAALQAERSVLTLRVRLLTASVGLIRGLGGGWSAADLPSARTAGSLPPTRHAPGSGQP